eukprot:c12172_g1_i1.p1 GENE.c12172_g1_i1~~c12172_g1_i1.p1  ORF type:complete len:1757 (+),score=438.88 c12172_g1_i1:2-5272(+)
MGVFLMRAGLPKLDNEVFVNMLWLCSTWTHGCPGLFARVQDYIYANVTSFAPEQTCTLLHIYSKRREINQASFFSTVAKQAALPSKLRHYAPVHTAHIMRCFAKAGQRNESLCRAALDVTVVNSSTVSITDLAILMWSFYTLNFRVPELAKVFQARLLQKIGPQLLSPEHLSMAIVAIMRGGYKHECASAVDAVAKQVASQVHHYPVHALVSICWALAEAGSQHKATGTVIGKSIAASKHELAPQQIASLMFAFAKMGIADDELLGHLHSQASSSLQLFSASNLAVLAWGMAKARVRDSRTTFLEIAKLSLLRISQFTPRDMAMLVWAYAMLRIANVPLLDALSIAAVANISEFSSRELANMLWAFSILQVQADDLFREATKTIISTHLPHLANQDLVNVLWACAIAHHSPTTGVPPIFLQAESVVWQRIAHNQFSPRELSAVGWAFAVVDHSTDVIPAVIKACVEWSDRICLRHAYQCYLALLSQRPVFAQSLLAPAELCRLKEAFMSHPRITLLHLDVANALRPNQNQNQIDQNTTNINSSNIDNDNTQIIHTKDSFNSNNATTTTTTNTISESDSGFSHVVHHLEDTAPKKGGLWVPKGVDTSNQRVMFQKPSSRLGLDKLAAQKREEKMLEQKRQLVTIESQDDSADTTDAHASTQDINSSSSKRSRTFRHSSAPDTPSHPGGVTDQPLVLSRHNNAKSSIFSSSSSSATNSAPSATKISTSTTTSSKSSKSSKSGGSSADSRKSSVGVPESTTLTPSRVGWDDRTPKRGKWDEISSPALSIASSRNDKSQVTATPLGTPSYKYNAWAKQTRDPYQAILDASRGVVAPSPAPSQPKPDPEDEKDMDRAWYDAEEALAVDMNNDPFLGNKQTFDKREKEMQMRRARGEKGRSARASALNEDRMRWEETQILHSGAARVLEVDTDFDNDDESRVYLMVHDVQPPFLTGPITFSHQMEMVRTVKDPTSDIAVQCRKGSALLRRMREQKERAKADQDHFNMQGSMMGKILGVPQKKEEVDNTILREDGEVDLKQTMSFKALLEDKDQAVSEFAKTKSYLQQREFLPIFKCRDTLLQIIRENSVIVIVGETGSGKTTQLTQYLHEEGLTRFGVVGCTQPRRVAAMSVAKRVSEEMGVELGKEVGYAIRFEDCTSKETVIKYMTDGVLLRESLKDGSLDKYSAIVMDEAHERSLNTDVLFGILRDVVRQRRSDLKLIVTSATMDSEKFSTFFGRCPVFTIPGRTFPVELFHSKTPIEDYVEEAVKKALEIHLGGSVGDILIFMTGQEDIETTCDCLQLRLDQVGEAPPLCILPIYSLMPSELQAKIFKRSDQRKCIVATNIAETSLTVDGIMFVIDTGFCKLKVFNPRIGMDALQITPVSQAGANQRKGRAGRTGPGKCWRLYTETAYNYELLPNSIPEIQRANLGNVVLLLKSLGIQDLTQFGFMDPPPQDNIRNSLYQLWLLNALDNTGQLTDLGRKMVEFPLDPQLSKMLIIGEQLGCCEEVLTIVSMLSVPTVFHRPKEREEESDAVREKFCVPESDHLTFLNVYQQWKKNNYSGKWATEHFMHAKALKKVREIRSQLVDIMKQNKMQLNSSGQEWDVVRKAISSAYFHNSAKLKGIGEYINQFTSMPCHLHPSSALYGAGYTPDYVVYHELVFTSKEYMRCVTAVDPFWLAEMGPTIFSIKESFKERLNKRQREKEDMALMAKEMEIRTQMEEDAKKASDASDKARSTPRQEIATPFSRAPATPHRTPRKFGI